MSVLLNDPKDKIRSKCLDCFTTIYSSLNNPDAFIDHIQAVLTNDQEIKVLRAIGNIAKPEEQEEQEEEEEGRIKIILKVSYIFHEKFKDCVD